MKGKLRECILNLETKTIPQKCMLNEPKYRYWIDKLAVLNIIEEARKEFPYVKYYVDTEDDEIRHEKINAWFEKWLGDDETVEK